MHKVFINITLISTLLVYSFLPQIPLNNLVLCISADGHIAFEIKNESTSMLSTTSIGSVDSHEDDFEHCLDISVNTFSQNTVPTYRATSKNILKFVHVISLKYFTPLESPQRYLHPRFNFSYIPPATAGLNSILLT